jgi:hypothetical protein
MRSYPAVVLLVVAAGAVAQTPGDRGIWAGGVGVLDRVERFGTSTVVAAPGLVTAVERAPSGTLLGGVAAPTPGVARFDASGTLIGSTPLGAAPIALAVDAAGGAWPIVLSPPRLLHIAPDGSLVATVQLPATAWPTTSSTPCASSCSTT